MTKSQFQVNNQLFFHNDHNDHNDHDHNEHNDHGNSIRSGQQINDENKVILSQNHIFA